MSPWKMLAVAAAVGLSLSTTPAAAEEGLGFGTEFAGTVFATSASLISSDPSSVGTEEVTGKCTYSGHTSMLSGKMNYVFAGVAVAHSTSTKQPGYTVIECELQSLRNRNDKDPEFTTGPIGFGLGAPVSAMQSTVLEEWPQQQARICVSGYALFGPSNPIRVDIPRTCSLTPL